MSTRAVTGNGERITAPRGASAAIISRDGPMLTGNSGPNVKRSGEVVLKDRNYIPRLNVAKIKGMSASTMCLTRKASLPKQR